MKVGSIKALILAILLGLTLVLSGCATTTTQPCGSAPAENGARQKCGDKSEKQEGIKAPAPAHEGGDDMERLD